MRCLVTGGAGFIGSNLCERLCRDGHEVICLDNLSAGRIDNIAHLYDYNFRFEIGDVCDDIGKYMDVDVVFHQAASKKNVCLSNPKKDCDVNAKGTLNLLMLAREHGVKKFIHASTGSVYGELHGGEEQPFDPVSYYGVSKLAGERYVSLFSDLHPCILRYFHVYGRRQDSSEFGGVVSIWIDKIKKDLPIPLFGTGEQQRSFTYIDDVVEANIRVLDHEGVYNCASGIKVTLNDLVHLLQKFIGYELKVENFPTQQGDIMCFDVDNTKIKTDFKLKFTDFDYGLTETLRYYQCLD
jgi:nucleoside-diphosphate-sugar epimerase